MKLRLYNNSIRFRLTKSEVLRLAEGETIVDMLQFAQSLRFLYELTPSTIKTSIHATFGDATLTVVVPQAIVRTWADSDEVGLYESQWVSAEGDMLKIVIEKDFRCINGDLDELDADRYPNPNAGG